MSRVWKTHCETHTQKLVLLALADNANDEGHCWPSVDTLARKCDLTDRAVRIQIDGLIHQKLVVMEQGGGREHPNHYFLFPVNPEQHSVNTIQGMAFTESHAETLNAMPKKGERHSGEPSVPIKEPSLSKEGSVKQESLTESNSVHPRVRARKVDHKVIDRVRATLDKAFKHKPGLMWEEPEERLLGQICQREDVETELKEILEYRSHCDPKYHAPSSRRLLEQWTHYLDRSRLNRNGKNLTVEEMFRESIQ